MANYDFSTLSDIDIEQLSRDLLQEKTGLTFQSFKKGKDKGIDLRYAIAENENNIIVQVKHYVKTPFKTMISSLKKDEVDKVNKLKPKRYIFITTQSLLPQNKEEIKSIFEPFILSTQDIWDGVHLNNLLGEFPEIEKRHYKLWFSSTTILDIIINNSINGRSLFHEGKIKKTASLFVPTDSYEIAYKKLLEKKFLIIKGPPGIGKTTLAENMILRLLKDGYSLTVIDNDIREAESIFVPNKKQVFLFDDFLGANYLELTKPINSDNTFISFIDRISYSDNKLFILTSRTTLLNQAKILREKLNTTKLKLSEFEIEIQDYSESNKALILYNHLYYYKTPKTFCQNLLEEKKYWSIIKHENYNPRLIKFITDRNRIEEVTAEKYYDFISDSLNNPEEIWKGAYENQIDGSSRFLLATLFSLSGRAYLDFLQNAYEKRLNYEITHNGFMREMDSFNNAIKKLQKGFINTSMVNKNGKTQTLVEFANPSITDFFISYYSNSKEERKKIIESAQFVEQILDRFETKGERIIITSTEANEILTLLAEKHQLLELTNKYKSKELYILVWILENISLQNSFAWSICLKFIESINWQNLQHFEFNNIILVCKNLYNNNKQKELKQYWNKLIWGLLEIADTYNLNKIVELFDYCDFNYTEFISDYSTKIELESYVKDIVEANLHNLIDDYCDFRDIESNKDIISELEYALIPIQEIFDNFDLTNPFQLSDLEQNINYSEILENAKKAKAKKTDLNLKDYLINKDKDEKMKSDIDDIFESLL